MLLRASATHCKALVAVTCAVADNTQHNWLLCGVAHFAGACPYPDDFSITCRTTNLRNATNYAPCGPNDKPVSVNDYCTAYPPGSVLAALEVYNDITAAGVTFRQKFTQEIACPAGAYSDPTKQPVIISYNGRTDCLCSITSPISCRFADGPISLASYPGGTASALTFGLNSPRLAISGGLKCIESWQGLHFFMPCTGLAGATMMG